MTIYIYIYIIYITKSKMQKCTVFPGPQSWMCRRRRRRRPKHLRLPSGSPEFMKVQIHEKFTALQLSYHIIFNFFNTFFWHEGKGTNVTCSLRRPFVINFSAPEARPGFVGVWEEVRPEAGAFWEAVALWPNMSSNTILEYIILN